PAGAGKSTLSRLLSAVDENITIGPDIELRKLEHIPAFLKQAPSWMPIYLNKGGSRRFTWEELKFITYLKEWPRLLRRRNANDRQVIVLDHGPIFRLATLREFGPENLKSAALNDWWSRLYRQWAFTIDIIVWLDTEDDVLVERINARQQKHVLKGSGSADAVTFLNRYRISYLRTLRRLMDYRQPRFFQFDTSRVPVGEIATEVLNACRA
ncbi:MAG TPA: hypothetical protein VIV15_14115, partial [Anaerolineales bacterium]